MSITNILRDMPFIGKLIEIMRDKSEIVQDTNIEGIFHIGENNGLLFLVEVPFRISNAGETATTINYFHLFILDKYMNKITYGFKSRKIEKKLEHGESLALNIGKIIPIGTAEDMQHNPRGRRMQTINADKLTLEKIFAEILVTTPHKKWKFQIPLNERISALGSSFMDDFKRVERMDKNFREAGR